MDDDDLNQAYYDDGQFDDDGIIRNRTDDCDIPTYDELDIEGRYYEYGSREDYNAWRQEQINERRNSPVDSSGFLSKTENTIFDSITVVVILGLLLVLLIWLF